MNATAELDWTGERLVTTCHRPLVFEHLHRYAIACTLAEGKRVLDIACGEGYGANLLGRTAAKVTGVDLDERTIAHARAKYPHRNIEFIVGDCLQIPCPDNSVDLVASFETIEHIDDHERFVAELKRVLAPGGVVVLSSPDKAEYRAVSGGANLFHKAELTHEEFVRLMQRHFRHCVAGKQRLVTGSWIAPDAASAEVAAGTFQGGFDGTKMERGVARGVYSLAICSDEPLPQVTLGLFEDPKLTAEVWHLLDREESPAQVLANAASSDELAALQRELQERTRQVLHFKDEAERQTRAADQRHFDLQLAQERFARLSRELEEARWDLLTFRGGALGADYSLSSTPAALDAQNRADVAEAERDTLRGMIHDLQMQLNDTSSRFDLLIHRVQVLLDSTAGKLMLAFSSPQRKLRRLVTPQR